MTVETDRIETLRRACAVAHTKRIEGAMAANRWRRIALALGTVVSAAIAIGVVLAVMALAPASAFRANATPDGDVYCGPWRPTGQPCAGGCLWQRECVICDEEGHCVPSHTNSICIPSGGAYCPLGIPPGYNWSESSEEWVDAIGRPLQTPF